MTKSIPVVVGIFTIAGTSFALTGCSGEGKTSFDTALQALNGGTPLLGSDAAEASLVEVALPVVEVERPAPPPMVEVCWEEPRRAGTWFERVCEMRPAT